jgi:hypothetical protein
MIAEFGYAVYVGNINFYASKLRLTPIEVIAVERFKAKRPSRIGQKNPFDAVVCREIH